jgi:putative endonuclease
VGYGHVETTVSRETLTAVLSGRFGVFDDSARKHPIRGRCPLYDVGVAYLSILECPDRGGWLRIGRARGPQDTRIRLPLRLPYFEQFDRVEDAYRRERQVQPGSRTKRLAVVYQRPKRLLKWSKMDVEHPNAGAIG